MSNSFLLSAKIAFSGSKKLPFHYQYVKSTYLSVDARQELGKMDLYLSLSADGIKLLKWRQEKENNFTLSV